MQKRLFYLDWLRLLAVFLGLVFHAGRPFDAWPWLVKGSFLAGLTFFQEALTTVRLPLLFFVSGAATAFALGRRTARGYVLDRFKRLMVPLGVGVLLITPPQMYIWRISLSPSDPQHFSGTYVQFLTGLWLGKEGHLTTQHLWFLLYLFIFSLLVLPLFLYWRSSKGQLGLAKLEGWLHGSPVRLWLLLMAFLGVALLLSVLLRRHPGLVEDLQNLLFYFFLFGLGFLLYARPSLLALVFRLRRSFLAVSLIAVTLKVYLFAVLFPREEYNHSLVFPLYHFYWILRDLGAFAAILASLAYAQKYLNKPSSFLDRARHWVYPFYIWHQTVIVVLGYFVVQWNIPAIGQYGLLLLASLVVTVFLSEAVQHSVLSRFLFGVYRKDLARGKSTKLEASS
ncbi:acyltransferase family protein [Meiothermus rufus]|uniref:acyltransferase family protein n=1 Tax=Meiothermus rufus TaxID=604332 RepID=UPI000421D77C|nr:acyltransferase family protein [Meiothermus rufus]